MRAQKRLCASVSEIVPIDMSVTAPEREYIWRMSRDTFRMLNMTADLPLL